MVGLAVVCVLPMEALRRQLVAALPSAATLHERLLHSVSGHSTAHAANCRFGSGARIRWMEKLPFGAISDSKAGYRQVAARVSTFGQRPLWPRC